MGQTVSDFVVQRMAKWGVRRVFAYPGDGINGIMGALARAQGEIEFVQPRHEELGAFMACAHAKFSGEVGVCIATSGPGAIHLLNGLYDAKMDHQPVVAIVGQQDRLALGGNYQQEVDLATLLKDVAGEYVHIAIAPTQVRHLIDRAFRIALAERTVTCVVLPKDLQEMDYEDPPRVHGSVHSSAGYRPPRVVPREQDLRAAAQVLNAGRRVAILVGAGALRAADKVARVAELLGAGVAKALLGRTVLPDALAYVTVSLVDRGGQSTPQLVDVVRRESAARVGGDFVSARPNQVDQRNAQRPRPQVPTGHVDGCHRHGADPLATHVTNGPRHRGEDRPGLHRLERRDACAHRPRHRLSARVFIG
jgi:pyruvate dehydrogenase (quinone)